MGYAKFLLRKYYSHSKVCPMIHPLVMRRMLTAEGPVLDRIGFWSMYDTAFSF
jgi:hypothetical protein